MKRTLGILLLSLALLVGSPATAQTIEAEVVAEEVRQTRVRPEGAVRVDGFRFKAGGASVVLTDGVLVPATPVAGRPVEFVFLGDGRIELEPPDEVESAQLELFTGSSSLVERFERAVFVIAFDAASDAVVGRPSANDDARVGEAAELLAQWHRSPERRLLDVEARIFADGVGDRLTAGFFCGYFEGLRLGRFLYVVDPLANEQVTLGQFVQPELTRREEKKARRSIEQAQRKGKLIGADVGDLGLWDTWVSTALRGSDGNPAPGARGVEPNHYEIDATLRGKELTLEATAHVSLRVVVDGLRAVAFELNPDFSPVMVRDGQDRELAWLRSRNEVVAVLFEPAGVGDILEIGISYTGRPVEKVASKTWAQRDTTGWYPHTGNLDRAAYTVTLQWPEELDVVAPGRFEDLGSGEQGMRRRRWRLDLASIGFSFEVGRYETATRRTGDVTVNVAVDRLAKKADDELAEEILDTVVDVVDFYSGTFGPLPLDTLQVVSSPRGFSQGLFGFITLSSAAVFDWEIWGALLGIEDRRTVIAHEVAHQWWGNLVGWRSYRDQWISEAMANYAAQLYARHRLDAEGDERVWRGPTAGWQSELLRSIDDGRPVESLGPLVAGARLDSSLSMDAYPAIVYKKGAVVLNMLSRLFGEEGFLEILREIVDRASMRVISTDDFIRGIAGLGGVDLDWFLRQYIYGTGLPEIYYSYRIEELDDGRWVVSGEASQQAPYQYRYEVVQTTAGGFDVHRRAEARIDVTDSVLVVPFQIGLADEPAAEDGRRPLLTGRLLVAGATSPFRLEVERWPGVFWLDRDAEVFGRFFNTDRWPRRITYYRGLDRDATGDADGARATFNQALSEEVADVPEGWEDLFRKLDAREEGERLDARIHLALARIDLDAGELSGAASELEQARDRIKSRDRWILARDLLVIESRYELLSGEAKAAFRRLKKGVLGKRGIDNPETWALLAIAAQAVGDSEVLTEAVKRADELGVDLGPLEGGAQPAVSP